MNKNFNFLRLIFLGLRIVILYLIILNISRYIFSFRGHWFIFPVFMLAIGVYSYFLKNKIEVIASFLPLWLIFFVGFFFPDTSIGTTLIYIVFIPLTFYLSFTFKKASWFFRISYLVLVVLIGVYGFTNLNILINNNNARQFTEVPQIIVNNVNDEVVRLDTIQNKILVLDFWSTSCGVCFKNFPKYEEVYLKYKDDPRVNIYAVNIPLKRDSMVSPKELIDRYNYKFPKLYAGSDSLRESFNINGFPTLVIIKDGKVRYNGWLIVDDNELIYQLDHEINRLLKE